MEKSASDKVIFDSTLINGRKIRPDLYKTITVVWLIGLFSVAGFSTNWSLSIALLPALNQAILALMVIWFALSIRVIKYNRQVGLLGFEIPMLNMQSGIRLIIWGFMRALEYPTDIQAKQFPGNPEQIFKGDDKDPLPNDKVMFRPIRLTTGRPSDDAHGILDIQAAVEVLFFLRISINDPLRFHISYGSVDGFWEQIRDIGQNILTKEFTKSAGLGDLIKNLPAIMERLHLEYVDEAKSGGVHVHSSGLDSPDLSKKLAEALRNLGVSKSEAEQIRIKLVKEGEGKAAAVKAFITATSEALANADEVAKAAYLGEKVLNDKTIILGTEGLAQAIALFDVIRKKENGK